MKGKPPAWPWALSPWQQLVDRTDGWSCKPYEVECLARTLEKEMK